MAREGTPAFTGLALHQDRKWRYRFWYPHEWHRFALLDNREGVLYAPDPADFSTSFSVEIKDLGTKITKDDVPDLYQGFVQGIQSLDECTIETQESWDIADLIGLEAKYTFREKGCLRKRWVRLLFEGKRQLHVVAQGASPAEYEYWLPMLFEMMTTLAID